MPSNRKRKSSDHRPISKRISDWFISLIDSSGAIVEWIFYPFEWALQKFSKSTVRRLEKSADSDSLWSKIGKVLSWPFQMFWNLCIRFSDWVGSSTILAPIFKRLKKIFRPLLYPLIASGNFAAAFYRSRSKRLKWLLIPVVALIGGLTYLVLRVQTEQRPAISGRYIKALDQAIDRQDFLTADLYRQKLRQLGTETDQFELQQADAMLKRGNVDDAFALVERLAPLEVAGLPQAHYWLATHLLGQVEFDQRKLDRPKEQRVRESLAHLDRLKEAGFDSSETAILRSTALINQGKPQEAQEVLVAFRSESLNSAEMRFKLDLQLNDIPEAKVDAEILSNIINANGQYAQQATADMLQLWFNVELFLSRASQANLIAENWYKRFPNDIRAAEARAMTQLDRFSRRWQSAPSSEYPELVELLISAGELLPREQYANVLKFLTNLEVAAKTDPKSKELYNLLLAQDRLPPDVSEQLGTMEAAKKNYVDARRLMESAVNWSPRAYTAWNNLSFILQRGFPEEYDLALAAADRAIELAPQNTSVRNTRVELYMRNKRWAEAIADLKVIDAAGDEHKVHEKLALAYRNSGDQEAADEQEALAK